MSGVLRYTYRCTGRHPMISLESNIARKLLNYLFMNPTCELFVNEIAKKLSLDKRNLVKKMKELEKEGIIKSQKKGNLKLYSINRDYPLYQEYKSILFKTSGFEASLRELISKIKGIKEAYIYGSYAKNSMDSHSDIDLMAIGTHSIALLQRSLNVLQKEIDREINVINMDVNEFAKRKKNKDPFINQVFSGKTVRII